MSTISQQLQQLQNDKQTLVTKLTEKGVTASNDETFTTLCPKVEEIESGCGDISEYFEDSITFGTSSVAGFIKTIKKLPSFYFNGTNASFMFAGLQVEKLDLSNFDTSNVTNMYNMFRDCKELTDLNVSNFNTSNVTNMGAMFYGCKLANLDLSNFDMGKVINISSLFSNGHISGTSFKFGFNLGKAYAQKSNNYSNYTLNLDGLYPDALPHDDLVLLINNLYDLNLSYDTANGNTLYTQKLVLGSKHLSKLTDEEISIATLKGWTVS